MGQEILFCSRCGKKRVDEGGFCSGCGFNFGEPSPSAAPLTDLAVPAQPDHRPLTLVPGIPNAVAVFITVLAVGVFYFFGLPERVAFFDVFEKAQSGPVAGTYVYAMDHAPSPVAAPMPTRAPTPIPGVTCDRGISAVESRHASIFGLMQTQFSGFDIVCGERSPTGTLDVRVVWIWNGQQRSATYRVDPTGDVRSGDSNSAHIDDAAKYGPLAIKMISGL